MKDLENPNYDNIHISILQNHIQFLFPLKVKRKYLRNILEDSLLPCIFNINKKSKLSYNLTNNKDSSIYIDEYINTIVRLLFSFNAFLLNFTYQYCIKNKINYYDFFTDKKGKINPLKLTNEDLTEKQNNKNSITELLTFLSSQKFVPPNLIYVFSLYENIFRHQHAHGWSLFFYQLLKELPKLYTYFNYDDNNISFILTNKTLKKTHIDIRKKLKLRALKKIESIDILPYMRFHPSDFLTDIDEELTFTINQKTNSKSIIALKNFGVDTKYTVNDKEFDMLDWYKTNKGQTKDFDLNLQALATKIFAVVTSINERI